MPYFRPPARLTARGAANLLAAAVLLGLILAIGSGLLDHARDQDFLNFYTGASLAREGRYHELHDPGVQLTREREIVPSRTRLVPFVRPHIYAAALSPLAALDHAAAFRVWLVLQAGFLLLFLYLIWRGFGSEGVLIGALYLPAALGFMHGQDNLMFAAAVAAGLLALERGRDAQAGLLWSVVLVKFHLAPGLALALLAARRWRALAAFGAGGGVLALASLLLGGWAGAAAYTRLLLAPGTEGLYPGRETLANLQGLAASLGLPTAALYATLGVAVAALLAAGLRRGPWWRQFCLALGGCLILTPHVYLYDLTILLPALLLSMREGAAAPVRALGWLIVLPPLMMAFLAGGPGWFLLVPVICAWLWLTSREGWSAPAGATQESSHPVPV